MKSGELVFLGAILVILGMAVIFAGMFKEAISSRGDDRESATTVVVLAIVLVLLAYFLFRRT
jgi:uncharacterized membrane protein